MFKLSPLKIIFSKNLILTIVKIMKISLTNGKLIYFTN